MWRKFSINKYISEFIDWLYPKSCIFCKEELDDVSSSFCEKCFQNVNIIETSLCPKCGKIRERSSSLCYDCRTRSHYFVSGRGMFVYDDFLKKSLFGLKFFKHTWIGSEYGKLLGAYYISNNLPEVDMIIPVPLHFLRYLERGYNQAEIIASSIAKAINKPIHSNYLKRSKATKAQKDLSDKQRPLNMLKAFKMNAKYVDKIKDKRILIIDDIYTTGSTMDGCAKVLLEKGAREVYFLTVAIGDGL